MIEEKGDGLCGYRFNDDYDCKHCENYDYCELMEKSKPEEIEK